jgi:subtilisin family serine protease
MSEATGSAVLEAPRTETADERRVFLRFPRTMALAPAWRAAPAARLVREVGGTRLLFPGSTIAVGTLGETGRDRLRAEGAEVFEDVQFSIFEEGMLPAEPRARFWEGGVSAAPMLAPTLDDVMRHIRAPQAWTTTRGQGVTIAVVDTGICPTLAELPEERRSAVDPGGRYAGRHWEDAQGHGSMCAAIAAGGAAGSAAFQGVAPEATVLAVRSDLTAVDIAALYGNLIAARRDGRIPGRLVISNSWGLYTCQDPQVLPKDHPFMDVILQAITEGAVVVFAAGNNHHDVLCHYAADADAPNTIWGPNSHDDVISVGTVSQAETNRDGATPHCNSSRGPGEWAVQRPKPDCVAPTYGIVTWGCGRQHMDWWGTSGACPQVAGLAALILARDPTLRPRQVADIILDSCREIAGGRSCVGAGIIDCEAAMRRMATS